MAFELPQPVNYLLNLPDPTDTIRKNVELSIGLQRSQQVAQAAQQDYQLKAQQIQQNQLAMQRNVDFRNAWQANAQNPTPGGISSLIGQFPEQTETITGASKALDAQEVKQLSPIHMAQLNGAHDVVAQEYNRLATAYDNSGNKERGDQLRASLARYQSHPGVETTAMGAKLANDMGGGEQYMNVFGKTLNVQGDAAKQRAESLLATNTANAALPDVPEKQALTMRALRAGTVKTEQEVGQLPETVQKNVDQFSTESNQAQLAANRADYLLGRLKALKLNGGLPAKMEDFLRQEAGLGNEKTDFRNQYAQLMKTQAMADLQAAGGKTGQGLIELEHQGFVTPTANEYELEQQLTRARDYAQLAANSGRDRAFWQTEFRGPNKARHSIVLPSGRKVMENDDYTVTMGGLVPKTLETSQPAQQPAAQGYGWKVNGKVNPAARDARIAELQARAQNKAAI